VSPSSSCTVAKLKATMMSCGATTLTDFNEKAVLRVVSPASAVQSTAEVQMRDRPVDITSA
jgi:IMP dehydrogenase